jgi:SAM-dependent methyltransferase
MRSHHEHAYAIATVAAESAGEIGPNVKLTGERPIEGKTPDSLLALHSAGYREVRARSGPGRFLDLGCGLGDGSVTFAQPDRTLVGLDYDAATAIAARATHGSAGLMTVCSDGSALSLADDSFDVVCSSHLIEHFTEPQFHAREVARVLAEDGTAFFLTPNAPADFENPYHVYLFEPDDLAEMLGRYFGSVTIIGIDATEHVKADFEKRRALARKLLAFDPLGLRHKLPRSWFVALHAAGRRVAYRFLAQEQGEGNSGITDAEFFATDSIDPSTLVLLAVAEKPLV